MPLSSGFFLSLQGPRLLTKQRVFGCVIFEMADTEFAISDYWEHFGMLEFVLKRICRKQL